MPMEIFNATRHDRLKAKYNDWEKAHPHAWLTYQPLFTTCLVKDPDEYTMEHTLVIFFKESEPSDEKDPFEEEEVMLV